MTALQQELNELMIGLPEDDAEKVLSYAAFLKHIRKAEDEEDIAAYLERKDEPSYSLDEVKNALGLR